MDGFPCPAEAEPSCPAEDGGGGEGCCSLELDGRGGPPVRSPRRINREFATLVEGRRARVHRSIWGGILVCGEAKSRHQRSDITFWNDASVELRSSFDCVESYARRWRFRHTRADDKTEWLRFDPPFSGPYQRPFTIHIGWQMQPFNDFESKASKLRGALR